MNVIGSVSVVPAEFEHLNRTPVTFWAVVGVPPIPPDEYKVIPVGNGVPIEVHVYDVVVSGDPSAASE